jgi:hypothetical protein
MLTATPQATTVRNIKKYIDNENHKNKPVRNTERQDRKKLDKMQCFGSGSVLDPDSIRSVSDPYSESESGSRRAKMSHKSRKKYEISCFEVLDVLF